MELLGAESPTLESYDLVIVGGGISGLYCAMKLMEKPGQLKERAIKSIVILERSSRWGGRLDTDTVAFKNTGVIKEEEGAMRFTYQKDPKGPKSNMPRLARLIEDLNMETEVLPFFMEPQTNPPPPELEGPTVPNCNARYFCGKHFTDWYATQNPTLWRNMFNLERVEEFKSAAAIVKDIYRKLLDHNRSHLFARFPKEKAEAIMAQDSTDQRLQEYEDTTYWEFFRNEFTWNVGMQEIPLHKFSMQALLTEMGYSHGCCMMMVQTQGFLFVTLSEGNVGCILQELITFNLIWNQLHHFKNGWSSLIKKVRERLTETSKNAGVKLELRKNCGVVSLKDNEKGFTLGLTTQTNMSAKNVVMALPPKAVEDILSNTKYWSMKNNAIKKICRSVEGIHCTKINLYFDNDWWNQEDTSVMFGPNMTSLPCGFVYPFYGECKSTGCPGCDNCSDDPCPAALTIYCDVNNAQFWSSLQSLGHKFQSPLQNQKKYKHLLAASEPVVHEALKQFRKIFNIKEIPHPTLTSYRSWDGQDKAKTNDEDPEPYEYGYAVHTWGLGVNDTKIMKKVTQPIKGRNLYLCNEAWSSYQGWVEGSLMSTQKVVDKILNPDDDDLFFGSCALIEC